MTIDTWRKARTPRDRLLIGVGGVGISPLRRRLAERYGAETRLFGSVVHAHAIVAKSAQVGDGAAIMAGAVVNPGARIGEHCIVNTGPSSSMTSCWRRCQPCRRAPCWAEVSRWARTVFLASAAASAITSGSVEM